MIVSVESEREYGERLIEDVLAHLDREVQGGSVRMSVEVDETQEEYARVSHKCCKTYGRDSTRMVAELDMVSDLHLQEMEE